MSPQLKHVVQRLCALFLLAVPVFAASCQSLVGIEERELGPCDHFCDVVMANCTAKNQVYENRAKCLGVCKLFDIGDSNEPQGKDTVACRQREADLAGTDSSESVTEHCRSAGPEGLNCGKACDSYCTLYSRACGSVACGTMENCKAKCLGVRNRGAFNLVEDYEGDSIQCRLVHLSNASIGRGPHCGHANLLTPTDHCTDVPDSDEEGAAGAGAMASSVKPPEPQCSDYCRTNAVACGTTEYENTDECLALCKYFVVGEFADTTQNTLGCRLYHSFNSLCGPEAHCPHSGPSGEGHCGTMSTDKCAAYCHLAKGVCPTQYADPNVFGNSDDACAAECAMLVDHLPVQAGEEPDTRYTVAYAATTNTLACRFLALSRAAVMPSLCASGSAFGAGDCAGP